MNVNSSIYFIAEVLSGSIYFDKNTEDKVNSAVNEFCSSECKDFFVAYYNCINHTDLVTFYNNGLCGRMNQQYCVIHFEFTSGVIIPPLTIARACGLDFSK